MGNEFLESNLVLESNLDLSKSCFLVFQKDDKQSYLDVKDGKWQFWGEIPVDESAVLFFESIKESLDVYIAKSFVMKDGKLVKIP